MKNKKPILSEILKSLCNLNFALLILVQSLNSFANQIVNIPVNKFGTSLGASASVIGMLVTLYAVMQTVTRPFSDIGLNKMDVKKWLQITLGLRVISFISYAITGSIPMFVVSRMLHGVSFSLVCTSLLSIASIAMDKKALGTAFGIYLTAPKIITSFAPIASL